MELRLSGEIDTVRLRVLGAMEGGFTGDMDPDSVTLVGAVLSAAGRPSRVGGEAESSGISSEGVVTDPLPLPGSFVALPPGDCDCQAEFIGSCGAFESTAEVGTEGTFSGEVSRSRFVRLTNVRNWTAVMVLKNLPLSSTETGCSKELLEPLRLDLSW